MVEVFVNSRTVVSTRVYPESGKCFGVKPFVVLKGEHETEETERKKVEDAEVEKQVKRFEVWELRGDGDR